MKVAVMCDTTHNPFDEARWVSCLRENLTSSSYGEGLETGRAVTQVPRQSLTRQLLFKEWKSYANRDYMDVMLLGGTGRTCMPSIPRTPHRRRAHLGSHQRRCAEAFPRPHGQVVAGVETSTRKVAIAPCISYTTSCAH